MQMVGEDLEMADGGYHGHIHLNTHYLSINLIQNENLILCILEEMYISFLKAFIPV